MLVSKKQAWAMTEQLDDRATPVLPRLRLDAPLRRKCLLLVVVLSLMAIIMTVQSELLVRSGYELVEIKMQVASMEKENEALHLDVAKLKSPGRIEHIATGQMGMILPAVVYHAQAAAKVTDEALTAAVPNNKPTPALDIKSAEASQKVKN
jgi:cell division protein FtsL